MTGCRTRAFSLEAVCWDKMWAYFLSGSVKTGNGAVMLGRFFE
ncbi:hypothetical protein DESPIG_02077 [Desulfovibrio piger ATCC 29098]|uniref:Uncharacterized protein n=1 Tax=Desulfovibrio piger ATCC 29098 TaxID=411464 RepID=B6WVG1_9BACT|nr:hypothetical protein DESPIG_02077 [Desulfovibrio piger ATCC 29098]